MNNAVLWSEANGISRRYVGDLVEEYEDEIGEMSGHCIDIGSGPGDVVVDIVLPKLNPKATVVCSDISDAMLEFGKEKYKDGPRVSFMKLNIETSDLPKDLIERFDHATSFFCLHWCQDMPLVFRNIFKLLQPGGTTLLTFVADFPGFNCYKKLAAMPSYQPYMKDADRFIPVFQQSVKQRKTLKALVEDVGFETHHCSIREKSYVYDNLDVFSKYVLSLNPFIERMPAELKKEYEKDLTREFAEQNIIFNKKNEQDYSVLCLPSTFIVFLKKPLDKDNSKL